MIEYGYKECPVCEGDGEQCNKCGPTSFCTCIDGEEKIIEICSECDGTGKVPRTLEDHEDMLDYLADQDMDENKLGHL